MTVNTITYKPVNKIEYLHNTLAPNNTIKNVAFPPLISSKLSEVCMILE